MSTETAGPVIYKRAPPKPDWLALHNEEVIEPELEIIDPHHHLWNENGGYGLHELTGDLASGQRINATVFVQCHWSYREHGPSELHSLGETERVAAVALEAERLKLPTKVCAGIVGYADMELGEKFAPILQMHIAAGAGRFRGVRHVTTSDPAIASGFLGALPFNLLERPSFQQGLRCLQEAGLSFDAWLYFTQIPQLIAVARKFPELPIVVNHLGGPLGEGPYRGKRDEVFAQWREAMKDLSSCPNVHIKLGGLGMVLMGFDFHLQSTPPSSQTLAQHWRPYMETAIELFGAKRCMFESNFPVDKGMCSYVALWNAFKRIAGGASANEKAALFSDTAHTFYRL